MEKPSYLLSRPTFTLNPEKMAAFEALWQATPSGGLVDYRLPYPKWEFLTYLCDSKELVLHGSQNQEINTVEPRQAKDQRAFSNQQAIYATTDGIWVIYFAIIDRKRFRELSLFNSCLQVCSAPGQLSEPMYFFSITQSVKEQEPWCQGMIYILPRDDFVQEEAHQILGVQVVFPHWISERAASPLARLDVGPDDFPFLEQIHGHNDEKLVELYSKNPGAFPIEAVVS
ncbi:MAG: hypothetical protein C3F13_13115 [Anaerolineales bacterium]|nr:hypothetical protein [Anaerolineae bacterium]PWB51381.1 MAG: hypothetical protein C3F13_13115 [Anaerolineales bacterium]